MCDILIDYVTDLEIRKCLVLAQRMLLSYGYICYLAAPSRSSIGRNLWFSQPSHLKKQLESICNWSFAYCILGVWTGLLMATPCQMLFYCQKKRGVLFFFCTIGELIFKGGQIHVINIALDLTPFGNKLSNWPRLAFTNANWPKPRAVLTTDGLQLNTTFLKSPTKKLFAFTCSLSLYAFSSLHTDNFWPFFLLECITYTGLSTTLDPPVGLTL